MDRAQEIRSMMKMAAHKNNGASASNSNVTGKDKAKLLKMMKDKNKPAAGSINSFSSVKKASKSDEKLQKQVMPTTFSVTLPANFFDDEPVAKNVKPPVISSKPSNSFVSSSVAAQDTKKTPVVSNINANLPMGFFDNPTAELTARGVNIQQHIEEQKKAVDNEFHNFLSEINVLNEEVNEDVLLAPEHETRDYEEQAMQMSYLTKLASLYQKSDAVVDRRSRVEQTSNSKHNIINNNNSTIVKEAATIQYVMSSSASTAAPSHSNATSTTDAVRPDVESILYRKLQESTLKKRKLQQYSAAVRQRHAKSQKQQQHNNDRDHAEGENNSSNSSEEEEEVSDDDEEDDSPLDFMNWTAKSV